MQRSDVYFRDDFAWLMVTADEGGRSAVEGKWTVAHAYSYVVVFCFEVVAVAVVWVVWCLDGGGDGDCNGAGD